MPTIFKKNFINDEELERQKKFQVLAGVQIREVITNSVNELVLILENGDEIQIMSEIGDYGIPFLYVEDVIPKETTFVSKDAKDEVLVAAQKLYADIVNAHPNTHRNWDKTWKELSDAQRFEYIAKVLDVKS